MLRELWNRSIVTFDSFQVNAALLLGRVLAVGALFPNGLRKIATFEQTAAAMGGAQQVIGGRVFPEQTPLFVFPAPEVFLGASIVFDLLGAALVVLGWRTRAIGALLAGYVIVAMVIFHSDIRGPADLQHIIRNLAFVSALLMLAGVGAGRWSLDGWRERQREKS